MFTHRTGQQKYGVANWPHGPKAAAQGIETRIEPGADAERPRRGDPHRLMQVLRNPAGDALKFTEVGSVALAVGTGPDGALTVEVADTGVGMSAETLSHAFEPFAQADSSTTRRYGGTGLGMTIMRRIVEAMGGAVSVESRLGQGTRVRVVAPPPSTDADDNEINRLALAAMLDGLGARATIVESGAQVVAAAGEEGRYDVILLGIAMPGMDGCEALERSHADERTAGGWFPPSP